MSSKVSLQDMVQAVLVIRKATAEQCQALRTELDSREAALLTRQAGRELAAAQREVQP